MKIEFTDCNNIVCDGKTCDFLSLYAICAECGNCPLVELAEKYIEIKLSDVF